VSAPGTCPDDRAKGRNCTYNGRDDACAAIRLDWPLGRPRNPHTQKRYRPIHAGPDAGIAGVPRPLALVPVAGCLHTGGVISSWQEAESLAAAHMRTIGFEDAATTRSGADGGLDVVARDGVAQVKHYSEAPVGSPAVQRLAGAAHGHRQALFYALTGYTPAALGYAETAGIALFTYDLGGDVSPVNEAANRFIENGNVHLDQTVSSKARELFVSQLQLFGQSVVDTIAVAGTVVNQLLGGDLQSIRAGGEGRFVTPENLGEVTSEALGLQVRVAWFTAAGGRTVADWATGIIETEALVQKVSDRFELDYEDLARAASQLREAGILGSGSDVTFEQISVYLPLRS